LFSSYKKLEMVPEDGLEPSRPKATDFEFDLAKATSRVAKSNVNWVPDNAEVSGLSYVAS